MADSASSEWKVEMPTGGRDGYISYYEGAFATSFYWELGGGDVLIVLHTGLSSHWSEQQREMLERVAQEVIRQRAPTCVAEIDEAGGIIYFRVRKPSA